MSTFADSNETLPIVKDIIPAAGMNSSVTTWVIIAGILIVFILLAIFMPKSSDQQSSGATPSASPSPSPSPSIVRPTSVIPPHVRRAQLQAAPMKAKAAAPVAVAAKKTGVQIV